MNNLNKVNKTERKACVGTSVNPFSEGIEPFIDSLIGICTESTIRERRSKLYRISRIMVELQNEGKIHSIIPSDMTVRDHQYFREYLCHHDIDVATQQKYLQILNVYLQFFNNNSVVMFRSKVKIIVPRKPIKSLTVEEIGKIFRTIEDMKGWRGSIARGMIYTAFQTLGRPSEIRTAELRDLDMIRERMYIRNPKGNGSFASGQWIDLLRPDFMPHIQKYLADREAYLIRKGIDSIYLFPNLYLDNDRCYSANAQRKLIGEISHRSGVEFSMKTLRATGADLFISADMKNLFAISAQLRHSDVSITQRYYADIQRGNVRRQLGDTYKQISIPEDHKF